MKSLKVLHQISVSSTLSCLGSFFFLLEKGGGEQCLGMLFISDDELEREMNRQTGALSAVMRSLCWSIVVRRELS